MKLSLKAGTTSKTVNIFIQDSSSTTGAGLAGLVFNTSSLTAYYALPQAAAVSITLATLGAVTSSWSSGGFTAVDGTNMPGWYRFDVPNAALASGTFSSIHFKGATNMAPLPIEIELTAVDNQSATAFVTSVASVVGSVGSVTGAVGSVTGAVGSVTGAVGSVTGLTASNLDATISSRATPTNITAGTITTVTNLTNAPTSGDLTSTMKTSVTTATISASLAAESYAADGAVPTLSQSLYRIMANLCEFSISGTTITAKKLDKSTTAETYTINSATAPTSRTRAT